MNGFKIMKKSLKYFGLFAAAALFFSCEKQLNSDDNTVTNPVDQNEQTVITPATDGNLLTSFGVTFSRTAFAPVADAL